MVLLHCLQSVLYVPGTSPADAANCACMVLVSKACIGCSSLPNELLVKHEKEMTSLQAAHGFLACRIEPIIMSAGELEHEWAGTPGRLIRERYRKAAEVSRVSPRLCAGVQNCESMPNLQCCPCPVCAVAAKSQQDCCIHSPMNFVHDHLCILLSSALYEVLFWQSAYQ